MSYRRDVEDENRDRTGPLAVLLSGLVRRVVVKLTTAANFWQLLGFVGAYGEEEVIGGGADGGVEPFQGVGFTSRPKAGAQAEAVAVAIGGEPGNTVVIASRDKANEPALEEDETATWNSLTLVIHKKNGTIELRTRSGAAVALATKADVDAIASFLRTHFDTAAGHTHSAAGAGPPVAGTGSGTGFSVPTAAGTQKVKAE